MFFAHVNHQQGSNQINHLKTMGAILLLFSLFSTFALTACGPGSNGLMSTFSPDEKLGNPDALAPDTSGGVTGNYQDLLRSGSSTSIVDWGGSEMSAQFTAATVDAIQNYGHNLMRIVPEDIENFCPTYRSLDEDQRLGFWTAMVSAIALPESSFIPTNIFQGRGRGNDAVTGQPLVGEGLMQLAYQDERTYANFVPQAACDFDYQQDQKYPRRDIRRSIQNPAKNLDCGVAILDTLVHQDTRVAGGGNGRYLGGARYWQVLRNDRTLKIIRNRTLNFCHAVAK